MTERIAHILVPLDFSTNAARALRYAKTLASRFGASLELLHVVEDPFTSGAWSSEIYVPNIVELRGSLVKDAEQRLAVDQSALSLEGVPTIATVRTGPVGYTIVEYAQAVHADLIVMGTHGRTGLAHIFMGSVAERVVRTAPCPVLTVREVTVAAEKEPMRVAEAAA